MRAAITSLSAVILLASLAMIDCRAEVVGSEWAVVESSGSVSAVSADDRRAPLEVHLGAHLIAPFTITTGRDGHIIIIRGEDRMTVAPDSSCDIAPPAAERGLLTRIRQTLGSVLYHVQHRAGVLFEVETPYLVSVVKGTTFNILVADEATTVALIDGRLLVRTPDGKTERVLETGQAAVKSRRSDDIVIKDQHALSPPIVGPIALVKDDGETVVLSAPIAMDASAGHVGVDATSIGNVINHTGISAIGALDAGSVPTTGTLIDAGAGLGSGSASLTSSASVSLGGGSLTSDLGVTASTGVGGTSIGASLSTGGTGLSTSVNVGGTSLSDSLNVGGTGLNTSLGVGSTTISAGVNLGSGTVSLDAGSITSTTTTGTASQDLSTTVSNTTSSLGKLVPKL